MKVLQRDSRDQGAIYLNPVRLPEIIRNSRRGGANGVLTNDCFIASTISCSAHDDCTRAAGVELEDIDWTNPVPGCGHIRLQMDTETVEAEFWYDEEVDMSVSPLSVEKLAPVADWIGNHPRIRFAYLGAPKPQIEISLLSDGLRMWVFRNGEIHETENTPAPAGAPTMAG